MKRVVLAFAAFIGAMTLMQAKVELAPVFADNMVFQQQSDAAVWGKAEPGAKVKITTTWSKGKVTAVADADGKWFARIATPVAGGPYEVTFNDGDKVTLKNVLVGEVWICSGQSNMAQQMKGYSGQPTAGSADLILSADPSVPIRSCNLVRQKSLVPMEECEATWYVNDHIGVSEASATAYFFAKRVYETLRIPVGIINASWGGTPIEAWMDRETLEKEFASELDLSPLSTGVWPKKNDFKTPTVLFNGMLGTLVPFTAKGFLWYQGCDNRLRYEQYTRLQPAFVKMLRKYWGNDKMPFYFTQIAPYKYDGPDKPEGGYMMWAQAQTLDMIPYSGMATTHDAGELACIHPANKKVVGDRLAYLALANDYGIKGFAAEAPIAKEFEFKDGMAYVSFKVGTRGLSPISIDLEGFELAGEDMVFYPAKGRVSKDAEGKRTVVKVYQCPQVPNPVAVRYGIKNWSEATLYNCFGVPASPFRSDNW